MYNDSNNIGTYYLDDEPYILWFDKEADYAIFEVLKTDSEYSKCIYSERVDVDNDNVKKEFIDYDKSYNY